MATREEQTRFLGQAIACAIAGAEAGRGGPFGAVVVKDGVVIAEACNHVVEKNDPTAHAEVEAIRAACAALGSFQLDGCEVYASCEPCPMCLGALFWARPRAVYFAATRADAAAAGFDDARFYDELTEARCLPRAQVPVPDAGRPFAIYARLASKVAY
jgi:guanine deaminase